LADKIDPQEPKGWAEVEGTTFRQAAGQWLEINRAGKGERWYRQANLYLFEYGKPFADMALLKISPAVIQDALKPLWPKAPAQARRTVAMWALVFTYCKANRLRPGDNPADWRDTQRHLSPPRPKNGDKHFSAMPYTQVPNFIRDLRPLQQATAPQALEFCILTATRTREALQARWSEVDLVNRIWTIPSERMGKTGKEHIVPLSDRAMALLALRHQYSGDTEYVFVGYSRRQPLAEKSLLNFMRRGMGIKTATVHGFRSAFTDWAGDKTDFADVAIEMCLSHQPGNAVKKAYRRQTAVDKRRLIMEAWADYCEGRI
jgi:integrase